MTVGDVAVASFTCGSSWGRSATVLTVGKGSPVYAIKRDHHFCAVHVVVLDERVLLHRHPEYAVICSSPLMSAVYQFAARNVDKGWAAPVASGQSADDDGNSLSAVNVWLGRA